MAPLAKRRHLPRLVFSLSLLPPISEKKVTKFVLLFLSVTATAFIAMDDLIRSWTHDNDPFTDRWPEIYDSLREASLPTDPVPVVKALSAFVLAESSENPPCNAKFSLVTMVIQRVIDSDMSPDLPTLIDTFARHLDACTTDLWQLHFLQTIYQKFNLGERCNAAPILDSLTKKSFVFHSDKASAQWQQFLTHTLHSTIAQASPECQAFYR
jgi:hypothetical protein